VLADGLQPIFSRDGRYLAYRSDGAGEVVRDLQSGRERTVPNPSLEGEAGVSYSWQRDNDTLVSAQGTVTRHLLLSMDVRPLDVDSSGTNLLVTYGPGDGRLGRLTLSSTTPVPVAGPASEATW
jgi:hypothetical protein